MARPEFSERHYELAVNLEMLRPASDYFPPSAKEEKSVGYDIALAPAVPGSWSRLVAGLPGIGSGDPGLAATTSLFLQFKRPDYISNRRGKQSQRRLERFRRHDPYYRIKLERNQLEVLLELQARHAGKALVSYMAARFHKRSDFYDHKFNAVVSDHSFYLPLGDIEKELAAMGLLPPPLTEDHFWTCDAHGGQGMLSSQDRPLEGREWGGLVSLLREVPEPEPFERHLEVMAATVGTWRREVVEPRRRRLPFRDRAEIKPPLPRPGLGAASPIVEAHEALDELGIGWFLAVRVRRGERDLSP